MVELTGARHNTQRIETQRENNENEQKHEQKNARSMLHILAHEKEREGQSKRDKRTKQLIAHSDFILSFDKLCIYVNEIMRINSL